MKHLRKPIRAYETLSLIALPCFAFFLSLTLAIFRIK